MSPVDTYKAARANDLGTSAACRAVIAAHPGIDFDDVVDMSWRIETGKSAPAWLHEDGAPTAALQTWERGALAKAGL